MIDQSVAPTILMCPLLRESLSKHGIGDAELLGACPLGHPLSAAVPGSNTVWSDESFILAQPARSNDCIPITHYKTETSMPVL